MLEAHEPKMLEAHEPKMLGLGCGTLHAEDEAASAPRAQTHREQSVPQQPVGPLRYHVRRGTVPSFPCRRPNR